MQSVPMSQMVKCRAETGFATASYETNGFVEAVVDGQTLPKRKRKVKIWLVHRMMLFETSFVLRGHRHDINRLWSITVSHHRPSSISRM
jgi:hypothetical protein